MSHTAIDQLFALAAPARSGQESSQSAPADGELFRSHLDRAAVAAEPKPPAAKNEEESRLSEKDEPLATQTGEQETSTTEQDQTSAAEESPEATRKNTEETQPKEEETTDEVTLSATAVAQSTEAVVAEQVVETVAIAGASSGEGQDQSQGQGQAQGQAASQVAEATGESATSTATSEAVELATELLSEKPDVETASEVITAKVEDDVEARALGTTESAGETQSISASTGQEEAKRSQSATASTNSQALQAKQQSSGEASETLPESQADEGSSSAATGRFEVPVAATTSDLAVATDAELALANLDTAAEPVASTTSPTTSTTETVAGAGRALGSLLASKTANAASGTNETPATETPTVDRARFVQRVGGAIRSAQNRDGQIQLRLSPPELGTLRINIVMNEGVLTAHLETETAAARAVLLDNLPALRERLAEQEIRIDKFDVDVGQEGQQQADNPEAEDRQANKNRSQANRASTRSSTLGLETAESSATQAISASGLDVRI